MKTIGKMKWILLSLAGIFIINHNLSAQDEQEGYQFTMEKEIKTTPVKNQYRSGTCWSFSTISFIESELLRMGKGEFDLSEMYVVRKVYTEKAKRYVRMHGKFNFGGGGALNDAIDLMGEIGLVPEEVYPGIQYGEELHVHGELDAVLKGYVDEVIENKNRKLTPVWLDGFKGILDAYLGEEPENFTYKGKQYTPESFTNEFLGLKPDDYIPITSYTYY